MCVNLSTSRYNMLFRRVVSCTAEINFFLFISRGKGIYKDWNILTFPPFLICHYTCNFKSYTTYFKKNSLECSYIRASIDIFACKQINVKFQYLSWMLNNIYCVPDVKETPSNTFKYCLFSCTEGLKRRKKKCNWFLFLC